MTHRSARPTDFRQPQAMTFWAYMLRCRDGSYHLGHTDHLDYRIGQHQAGEIPGYTATRLPVELVWSAEFPTRFEELEAERRIKGWSRAKKERSEEPTSELQALMRKS